MSAAERSAIAHSVSPIFSGVDFQAAQLFDTSDPDHASILAGRIFSPHSIKVGAGGNRFRSRLSHLALGRLSLNRLTWGAGVAVDPGALASYYLLAMPLKGHARFHIDGRAIDVSPHAVGLISPGQRFHFEASEGYAQIVVRIERSAMEHGYEALTGRPCGVDINFSPVIGTAGRTWRAVEPWLQLLARSARRAGTVVSPDASALELRIEDMLVSTLLLQQPHTLSERLLPTPPTGTPRHVRRAQAYLLEHLEEPLTVAQVAVAVGVSVRTLQAAFSAQLGCGPMQWLREQRLFRIRDLLCADDCGLSITAIAMRYDFTHPGEFARAYRRMFGETASQSRRAALR